MTAPSPADAVLPPTPYRVALHSAAEVNARIAAAIGASVRWHAEHPGGIEARLRALDREWDIERVLEANAASVAMAGVLLGLTVHRRFLLLPGIVAAFLLQHALQGWCPPVAIFRRAGVRTAREIDDERHALKALRGDYDGVATGAPGGNRARAALAAARR
jgi:hypothetical protein